MNDLELMSVAAKTAAAINPQNTKSNPRVGCLVMLENKIVATGAHEFFGDAHAEVNALKGLINSDLTKATIYITLEPCVKNIGKKTPACTDLLLKVKPARVVIGALDPHFPNQGVSQLKAAGINVTVLRTDYHELLNPWFKTWITQEKPVLTLKIAQSLDGKITPAEANYLKGDRAITGKRVQVAVHNMRATHQALLTSTQTVLEDNPVFDVRHANNLSHPSSAPEVIIVGSRKVPDTAKLFSVLDRKVHLVQKLEDLKTYCLKNNLASILTECGGTLNTALIEASLVNQIEIFTAPIICGNTAKPSFVKPKNLSKFSLKSISNLENDLWQTFTY